VVPGRPGPLLSGRLTSSLCCGCPNQLDRMAVSAAQGRARVRVRHAPIVGLPCGAVSTSVHPSDMKLNCKIGAYS
jgi:hypothetical protein